MFGYIIPDKPNLYLKDYGLYRSLYCGICVATKFKYGQFARLTTNYDVVFLSALIHNYLGHDVDVSLKRCALHPFKRRPIATPDDITNAIVGANVLLVYYNLTDDVMDEGSVKKRVARQNIKSAFKKAKKEFPQMEEAIRVSYEKLRELEKNCEKSVDVLADPFATMMMEVGRFITGDKCNDYILNLAYNFGKWVYIIDAVDDLEKDFEREQFNPLINAYGDFESREQFIDAHREEIEYMLSSSINAVCENYSSLTFKFNRDLTDNIVFKGLPTRTKGVLDGTSKGKTPKI